MPAAGHRPRSAGNCCEIRFLGGEGGAVVLPTGVEVAGISIVSATEVGASGRWDAEAFNPPLRRLERALHRAPPLAEVAVVTHPAEIPRVYTGGTDGVPFVRA